MNKFSLLTLLLGAASVTQLPAMEPRPAESEILDADPLDTPPPVPPRWYTPPPAIPAKYTAKPLPPVPSKQPAIATSASSTVVAPASGARASEKPTLSAEQNHSIQKIEEDINKLMENNVSIAKHGIELGKSASSKNVIVLGKESGIIITKLGSSSLLVANIYKHAEKLSAASPEVQAVARKKIMSVIDSPQYKASEAELIKLAADDSLPSIVREPLRKFATQIAELPGLVVKQYLNKHAA